uniref:Uncharacterized protein n=1 Tax=Hyaloperonospora arabidopsidis (strain Emoy2) TaxID=559515 RepID=M4BT51_HYAAE
MSVNDMDKQQHHHAALSSYELVVKSKDAKGSATCWCLFCVHEGHDEVEVVQNGRKRKRTGNIQMFTVPFYLHKYRSHLESQHANSWALYKNMSNAEKALYFAIKIMLSNTLHRHIALKDDTLMYDISARIFKTIISDLVFRDDEVLADSDVDDDSEDDVANTLVKKAKEKPNSLKLFVKKRNDVDWYRITIKNVMRFNLAMGHVWVGLSFRQTASAIEHAGDHKKTAKLTVLNDKIVGQYVRVLVEASLQDISDMMGDMSVWAVLLAFDSSMHRDQSFLRHSRCNFASKVSFATSIWSRFRCSIATRRK